MQPLDDEHLRLALLRLHQTGRELTPEELREATKQGMAAIRAALRSQGYEVPDDDAELFLYLQRLRAKL